MGHHTRSFDELNICKWEIIIASISVFVQQTRPVTLEVFPPALIDFSKKGQEPWAKQGSVCSALCRLLMGTNTQMEAHAHKVYS